MSNNLAVIQGDIEGARQAFGRAAIDPSIRFEAEAGFAMQTLAGNEYAMSVAMRNRQSVINAVINIAAIGISLNPAKKQAYLVPRDGKICLDISYMGLMDLARQSGAIRWAQCALVHEADEFTLAGLDRQPVHKFNPFAKDRGAVIGVYCVVKTADGDYLTHAMAIADVFAIRDKSQSWVAYSAGKSKSCIWQDHEGEMVKKTAVKQAAKYWPRTEQTARMEQAIQYLNEEAGEGLQRIEPIGPGVIKPTDGAMERMERDVQNDLRELAAEAIGLFTNDGIAAAIDKLKAANLDNGQTIAVWTLLPSDFRAAIKKEKAARDEAAAALATT